MLLAAARMQHVLSCVLLHVVLLWLMCHADSKHTPQNFNQVCLKPLDGNATICYDYGAAEFGEQLLRDNLIGYGIVSSPKNACSPVKPISPKREREGTWFLLIQAEGCLNGYKALMAQNGGYNAAIIYSTSSDDIIKMHDNKYGRKVSMIVAVYVGKTAGKKLISDESTTRDAIIITPQEYPYFYNLEFYVIPFAVIVGICFVLMSMFMISRYYRHYLERRRNRLSPTNLCKIPTKKFKKGDEYYDVCAICLDEYKEGDRLRILPCDHAYHCKCVDPWLTEGKRTCPVCKRPVEIGKKRQSRGGETAEQGDRSEREPTETTPLIQPSAPLSSDNTLPV